MNTSAVALADRSQRPARKLGIKAVAVRYDTTPVRLAFWAASRLAIIALIVRPRLIPALHAVAVTPGDVRTYQHWSLVIAHGSYPSHDPKWQYPPLAALVIVAPRLLPVLSYLHAFMLLAVLADLLVLLMLLRVGSRPGGVWVWNAGLVLLGATVYLRYDVMVTACAVAALLALPRTRLLGVLAAVGALLKAWPILLIMGLPRDRRLINGVAVFAATAAAVLLGGKLVSNGQASFLSGQSARGMEVEAVAVTPLQLARLFGRRVTVRARYGSLEVVSHTADMISIGCVIATVIGLALLAVAVWRRRPDTWTPVFACDVTMAATLVVIVTSRVLSPQYLIWVTGVGACCMAVEGSRQRWSVLLVLLAALLSQAVYPFSFDGLLHGHVAPIVLLVVRNVLLLGAAVLAVRGVLGWPPEDARRVRL